MRRRIRLLCLLEPLLLLVLRRREGPTTGPASGFGRGMMRWRVGRGRIVVGDAPLGRIRRVAPRQIESQLLLALPRLRQGLPSRGTLGVEPRQRGF
jgi:hypothetical protein